MVEGAGRDSQLDEDVEESRNCGCSLSDEASVSCGCCRCGEKRHGPQDRGRTHGKGHVMGVRKWGLRAPVTEPRVTGNVSGGVKAALLEQKVEGSLDLVVSGKRRDPERFVDGDDFCASFGTLVDGLEGPVAGIGVRRRDIEDLERVKGHGNWGFHGDRAVVILTAVGPLV